MLMLVGWLLMLHVGGPSNPAAQSNTFARSQGNDVVDARSLARAIFTRIEPVQILKVRVEKIGRHTVAGLSLSGVKFHGKVTKAIFLDEILRLRETAFATKIPFDEIDIHVSVPLHLKRGVAQGADGYIPVDSTVFSVTSLRQERATDFDLRLKRDQGVYWDPGFKNELERPDYHAS